MSVMHTAYRFILHLEQFMVENEINKTLQASPAARCRDAQTGGLLISSPVFFTSAPVFANKLNNTPAMPLNDAHFGGFFASGGCR